MLRHGWIHGLLACLMLAGSLCTPLPVSAAQANGPANEVIYQPTGAQGQLTLIEGDTRLIQLPTRIRTVDGFDDTIIKVTAIQGVANQVRVQAVAAGSTRLVLKDENDHYFSIDILVNGDTRQLESVIRNAFPEASITAVKVKDSVLLTGWVNQQDQLTPIINIAEEYFPKVLNYVRVGGVQQVMLRVKIMEVQRSRIRRFGFNFLHLDEHGYVMSTPGLLAPLAGTASSAPMSLPFGGPASAGVGLPGYNASNLTFGIAGSQYVFNGFLEALKEERLLKILAEPNLVTVNGRQATFLNGGEFPVPVPQSLGTVTIQWREFGVKLAFVPYILGAGRLRLDVQPEVSDQDPSTGVTLNGTTVNGLSTRKVETQVEMNFGQTLVIAGLINNRTRSNTSKVPFLGELPWIGAAFRRVKEDYAETELLVMVTPDLVSAMDPEQVPPDYPGSSTVSPTDKELYIQGLVEVPSYGPECPNCPPGMGYPAGGVVTPAGEPQPTPPNGNYDATPNPGAEPVPPSPNPPNGTQALRGQQRLSTRPSYLANRPSQVSGNRVQQAGVSNTSQYDPALQQTGYSTPQSSPTRARTSPSRIATRPGMIAPSTP